jgi:anti-sigma factor ChrR (cupin superfamily)
MRRHSAHVDANVLAELSAGLISGRRATRIHVHLAGCQRCASVSAGLSGVPVLLASVPPSPMPEAVTTRLSAVIAAEAAARSAAAAAAPEQLTRGHTLQPAGTAGGGPPRRRWPGWTSPVASRAFATAAAVCLVAAGGYAAVQLTSSGSPGPSVSAGAATRTRIGTAVGPYHVGASRGGSQLHGPAVVPAQPAFSVVTSGIDYKWSTLSAQIESELSKLSRVGPDTQAGKAIRHTPTAQQNACALEVTSGVTPTLVDVARYQGHPATIVALKQKGDPYAQAWVVGPKCSGTQSDQLTHVWLYASGG